MANYEGKFGTKENNEKDNILESLFLTSSPPDLNDADETLETPLLVIDLDAVDLQTKDRARTIIQRLSDYYFDPKYIEQHPYIPNKIAQEMDNIRRLLKMLTVNEKAQDTLIASITMNASKGTLYGSLTSLQNSMLQMQTQLNNLTENVENIFKEMQENCEKTFEEKDKDDQVNEDGSFKVRGSKDFIEAINKMLEAKENNKDTKEENEKSANVS